MEWKVHRTIQKYPFRALKNMKKTLRVRKLLQNRWFKHVRTYQNILFLAALQLSIMSTSKSSTFPRKARNWAWDLDLSIFRKYPREFKNKRAEQYKWKANQTAVAPKIKEAQDGQKDQPHSKISKPNSQRSSHFEKSNIDSNKQICPFSAPRLTSGCLLALPIRMFILVSKRRFRNPCFFAQKWCCASFSWVVVSFGVAFRNKHQLYHSTERSGQARRSLLRSQWRGICELANGHLSFQKCSICLFCFGMYVFTAHN